MGKQARFRKHRKQQTSAFHREVRKCAAEIGLLLPELSLRHSPLVVVAALSEYVGGGLLLNQAAGRLSSEYAQELIQHVEALAFGEVDSLV